MQFIVIKVYFIIFNEINLDFGPDFGVLFFRILFLLN